MHEAHTGQEVANPRRTRLGADWVAGSGAAGDRARPVPGPESGAVAGERPVG
ncbi:hypothetical protein [Saccharothrix sp. Mg75]|uniref:hypothetical protein n=1 Tax=Saccharothrix sp. Mg75 TaxID=3445357 RepID=UPI003EEA2B0F